MGLVERWNRFAKKSIYINSTFEIGCGRLVLSTIIVLIQVAIILGCGGNLGACSAAFSTYVLTLKQQNNKIEEK